LSRREAWLYESAMPFRSWANCSQSRAGSKSPSWIAVRAVFASVSRQSFWLFTTKSRAGRGGHQLRRGGHEGQPPAGWARLPCEPALEERAHAPLAAWRRQRRLDHLVDEAPRRQLEHLDLQVLFRLEVREEPALRELEILGQTANGQALEPDLRGQAERVDQDGLPV